MRCPQCGARNPLGSESCSNCGRPFTRAANGNRSRVAAGPPTSPSDETARVPTVQPRQSRPDVHVHYERDATYDDYEYGYDDRFYDPPPRRRGFATMGCLPALVVLLAVVVGVIIGLIIVTNMYVKPRVTDAIADNVGSRIETSVAEQISSELGDIPAGEVTISETDINQRIAERNLGPIDNLTVDIVPNGVEADMSAYGLSGGYSADIQHQDGRIVLTNGEVSGPLQYLVSEGDITQIASDAINRSLSNAGYRVEGVTLQDGQILLSLAR